MRATGKSPLGPFTFQEHIVPPFHHGAHVDRAPDGTYVVFGDGEDTPSWTVQTNCFYWGRRNLRGAIINEATTTTTARANTVYGHGTSPQDYHIVATSSSIRGPWTQHVIMQTDLSNINSWSCNVTNLAPMFLANGTIVMAFRSRSCVADAIQAVTCGYYCEFIGLAVSTNGWQGPFIKQANPIAELTGNEDPFLWQSSRGYHILMHGKIVCGLGGINTCGSLGFSEDLVTWYMSPFPVYGQAVTFSGGNQADLALRQRPKILFNSDGVPLVLYNGGQLQNQGFVRNFAFAFNTAAMRNWVPPPPCPPKPQFKTLCLATPKGVLRTAAQCAQLGSTNCVFCPNLNKCMYGGSDQICTALKPENFYNYC